MSANKDLKQSGADAAAPDCCVLERINRDRSCKYPALLTPKNPVILCAKGHRNLMLPGW